MNNRTRIIIAIILAGFIGLIAYMSITNKIDFSSFDLKKEIAANEHNGNISEHTVGDKNSKVVLIEYADFQCGGCAAAGPRVKKMADEYKDKIHFIFRNFNLDGHQNALSAAAAVEAAGLQGKYWEMNQLMFSKQMDWAFSAIEERNDIYTSYAKQLNLDETKFNEDMKSQNVRKKIAFDKETGKKLNIDSTPSFFLNGEKLSNDVWGTDASLREAIDKAIEAAK